jgi:hypothetical protein
MVDHEVFPGGALMACYILVRVCLDQVDQDASSRILLIPLILLVPGDVGDQGLIRLIPLIPRSSALPAVLATQAFPRVKLPRLGLAPP